MKIRLLLAGAVVALAANGATLPGNKLSTEQKILHVLDRLTFGARPGDFEAEALAFVRTAGRGVIVQDATIVRLERHLDGGHVPQWRGNAAFAQGFNGRVDHAPEPKPGLLE